MRLGDTVVLDYVVTRCSAIDGIARVVVATSELEQDNAIARWCEERIIPCFRGSEKDVLSRYYHCAKQYSADFVIRVTADCPFLDMELAGQIITAMYEKPADLVMVRGSLPRGLAVEMMSFSALDLMHREGNLPRHREHVTYFAADHPDRFAKTIIDAPADICHPEVRLTLDTAEDYQLCKIIAKHFAGNLLVPARDVVRFLLDHPQIASINANVKQKPVDG